MKVYEVVQTCKPGTQIEYRVLEKALFGRDIIFEEVTTFDRICNSKVNTLYIKHNKLFIVAEEDEIDG